MAVLVVVVLVLLLLLVAAAAAAAVVVVVAAAVVVLVVLLVVPLGTPQASDRTCFGLFVLLSHKGLNSAAAKKYTLPKNSLNPQP